MYRHMLDDVITDDVSRFVVLEYTRNRTHTRVHLSVLAKLGTRVYFSVYSQNSVLRYIFPYKRTRNGIVGILSFELVLGNSKSHVLVPGDFYWYSAGIVDLYLYVMHCTHAHYIYKSVHDTIESKCW